MAFDIMSLFGPSAVNRMLQPAQNTNGVQNFLVNPQAAQPQTDPWLGMREADVQAVAQSPRLSGLDAQQTGSTITVPDEPGGWDKYSKNMFRQNLNDFFLGLASGRTPMESLSLGALAANSKHNEMKQDNHTATWLQSKGVDKELAWQMIENKPLLQKYLTQMMTPADPMKDLQRQKMELEIANLQNPQAKLTDDQREYQAARDQGFQGSFMDYMVKMKEAGRQQVNIDTGEKLPSGFRWVNPDQRELGVEPIPGGPATQIPGELAARIGMGENWLQNDLPTLRDPASLEAATGPIDRAMAWAGKGKPAEIERKFQSGVEVLSRLLSGAGMTQIEVDEKTKRYMPTIADDANSLMTKLNQLEAEIRAAGNAAMRGRGGKIEAFPSGGANKPISEMSDQELKAIINGER